MQELLAILEANQAAPQQLAALFKPYMYLLQLDPVEHAHSFAEGKWGPVMNIANLNCIHV